MQGFVQRRIVLVAFPDRAALIQCPDKRRTLSIIPNFNPAVGLHPACDIGIRLLKTGCSLWHFLLTPSHQWSGQKSGGDSAVSAEFLIAGMIFHPSRVKS